MSLEDLDKVIAESDPSALQNIEGVRAVAAELTQPIEIFEADLDLDDAEKLKKLQGFKAKLKLKAALLIAWLKNLAIESVKKLGVWAVEKKTQAAEAKQKFRHWPTKSKLLLQAAVLVFIGVFVFAYFAFVKKSLFYKPELFMTSLEVMAENTYEIPADEPLETFYNSSKIPKSIFNLKKIVVNIRPSAGSGPNPMVAFEFSLEGNSSEVLLEIKDREGEILDQVQRTIEEYTFDDLDDMEGKRMITEKVRTTVNRVLTLGKIRKVYIQGIILKQ